MNKIAFLLTFAAGLSTMIGTFFIFLKKKDDNIIISSLSFAAGVMSMVSLIDLIPEAFSNLKIGFNLFESSMILGICFCIGVIFSMLIDKYLPDDINITTNKKGLYRVGMISMLAIILHNIPEGIATFTASSNDLTLGLTLCIAIALHNIPEGISISVPIYYATGSKIKAFLYTLISGLSEPVGAALAFLFLKDIVTFKLMGCLLSIIAGIMLHISFYELLPSALNYNKKRRVGVFFILGNLVMIISHLLLK